MVMTIIIYFILQRNMSSYSIRALLILQQYYFAVGFVNDDGSSDALSKATPICYITCSIEPENYFILCQQKDN